MLLHEAALCVLAMIIAFSNTCHTCDMWIDRIQRQVYLFDYLGGAKCYNML